MFVAASTRCFGDLPLDAALERLVDLEYSAVEIVIHETGGHLKPSEVLADPERALQICRQTHRLSPIAYSVDIDTSDEAEYYRQFTACCKLAKATKVVTIVIRAAELGTPFNAEVERLAEMVGIASEESVRIGLLTEVGRMTQDPDTTMVLCDNVEGLSVTLDPSHFIYRCARPTGFEQLLKYVCHVRLRDTSKDQLQVRVGQGEIEYGRLITQLNKYGYSRALCVDLAPLPGVEQSAEMRKMRLLLESLL